MSDDLDEMTSEDVIDLIADLRGGYPETCDFCKERVQPEQLVPEEAGLWACLTCWNRWEAEDRQRRAELEAEAGDHRPDPAA